ncbi:hypothetical protein Tco_0625791 [Tanacetum coccineum]|uniref:Uncharacterized protein n=1 Tax=Tanacetum coccineum TaxID=301880 RepID=A0ABQ4WHT6_9ASTR
MSNERIFDGTEIFRVNWDKQLFQLQPWQIDLVSLIVSLSEPIVVFGLAFIFADLSLIDIVSILSVSVGSGKSEMLAMRALTQKRFDFFVNTSIAGLLLAYRLQILPFIMRQLSRQLSKLYKWGTPYVRGSLHGTLLVLTARPLISYVYGRQNRTEFAVFGNRLSNTFAVRVKHCTVEHELQPE